MAKKLNLEIDAQGIIDSVRPDIPSQKTIEQMREDIRKELREEVKEELRQELEPTPHRVSSKQRRLSLDEYGTVFLPVPKIDHPKPVFISESLRDVIGLPLRLSKNLTRWHEGLEASE